ncbi:MAG: DUF3127 domain-containing protein [Deltaproteobacteria bacterium]|nr:DUF3127 domain-containing protein [Deltaproteobacteria bacterium]
MATDEYEATGILYKKMEAEQITPRFRKRELVLELPGRFPQLVCFELTGDRCEMIDGFDLGEELVLTFRLKGREWTGRGGEARYFNGLDVVGIARKGAGGGPDPDLEEAIFGGGDPGAPPASDAPPPGDDDAPGLDDDEIPF